MFSPMPQWKHNWEDNNGNRIITKQLAWDCQVLQNVVNDRIPQLNNKQMEAYNNITDSVTK